MEERTPEENRKHYKAFARHMQRVHKDREERKKHPILWSIKFWLGSIFSLERERKP